MNKPQLSFDQNRTFSFKKMRLKCRLRNGGYFVQGRWSDWQSTIITIETYPALQLLNNCMKISLYGPFTGYVNLWVAHASGMPGTFAPPPTSGEPRVSDLVMHHGTCVTHMPWCISGSLTRGDRESVPSIPVACATHNFAFLVRGTWRIG